MRSRISAAFARFVAFVRGAPFVPADPDTDGVRATELLAAIVQGSDDAIVGKTLDGIVTSWNGGAERMFGYRADEAVGSSILLVVPPDRVDEERTVLARARRGEAVEHFETVRVAKDGRRIDVSISVSPIRDRTGRIVGASKIVRDITERKRADEERKALLERERAARMEAEAANRAKDEFLAMLSHELRTPLTSMLGWVRMLRSGLLAPEKAAYALETIERNARVQAELINELLDVSRIIAGKVNLERYPTELQPLIEETVLSFRVQADAKGIELVMNLDPRVGPVFGDAVRLQQVVGNVIGNAIKFTPAGGRIDVELESGGERAVLTVRDTGEGIPPELLPHVFDRFRQAHTTTRRPYSGLGLGLAIVRHLVELHGGTVRAESPGEGAGTTFTIELPLMTRWSRRPTAVEGHVTAAEADTAGRRLDGVRLLLVEDHDDSRQLLMAMLTERGAEVVAVASAAEAIDVLNATSVHIVVSDLAMPGTDGFQLIRWVRERERQTGSGKLLPAVALTALVAREDRDRALQAGFQAHLAKPVDPQELVDVVARLVERRGE